MGIIRSIKKRLPIIGSGSADRPIQARPTPKSSATRPAPYTAARPEPEEDLASPRGEADPKEWIQAIVKEHPVVVFMKGTPMSPQCGFSANAAAILRAYEKPLYTVDVISDPEVRQAVKELSNWPTIPQIYIGGEFMGGSDILQQMSNNGELDEAIGEAFAKPEAPEAAAPAE